MGAGTTTRKGRAIPNYAIHARPVMTRPARGIAANGRAMIDRSTDDLVPLRAGAAVKVLILDDERHRRDWFAQFYADSVVVQVETVGSAISAMEVTDFDLIHLDHDLGTEPEVGGDVARWLIEHPDVQSTARIIVHSVNAVAAPWYTKLLQEAGRSAAWIPFGQLLAPPPPSHNTLVSLNLRARQPGASLNIAADLVYRALRAYDQDRAYFDPQDGRTWGHDATMWLLDNGYSVPASECER